MWRILTKSEIRAGGENIYDTHLVLRYIDEKVVPKPFPHCTTALVYGVDKNWTYYFLDKHLLPKCEKMILLSHPCGGNGNKLGSNFQNLRYALRFARYFAGCTFVNYMSETEEKELLDDVESEVKWKEKIKVVNSEILFSPPTNCMKTGGLEYIKAQDRFYDVAINKLD